MAKIKWSEAQKAKREEYERLCRTPGTPQHQARQDRINQRTRELQREQDAARRKIREENAARALANTRAALAPLLAARNKLH